MTARDTRWIGILPCLAFAIACAWLATSERAAAATYRQVVNKQFSEWVNELWNEVEQRGVSRATFDKAFKGLRPDWSLRDLDLPDLGPGKPAMPKSAKAAKNRQQAEFGRPARYFPQKSLNLQVKIGRQKMAAWKDTLAKIEDEYGVQRTILVAIWGRETGFGGVKMPHDAIRALATQAFMGRRKAFFKDELLQALDILQGGHGPNKRMRSSWAGAMGHTQFLPSHFHRYAVDFNGDGKRDIWGTVPDALASTANFLKQSGWEKGKTWGYEVRLPKGFDCTLEGPTHKRTIEEWVKLGLKRTLKRSFPEDRLSEPAYLVLPAGTRGPAFLVLQNFVALRAYNTADLYALYVGHLADRLQNNRAFAGRWARLASFGRADVRVMQERFAAEGFDVGKIDGLIGGRTRAATGLYQRKHGLAVNCYPSRALLKHVKAQSS